MERQEEAFLAWPWVYSFFSGKGKVICVDMQERCNLQGVFLEISLAQRAWIGVGEGQTEAGRQTRTGNW